MDEVSSGEGKGGPNRYMIFLGFAVALAVTAAAAWGLYSMRQSGVTPAPRIGVATPQGPLARFAKGAMAKLQSGPPSPAQVFAFNDRDGKPVGLDRFRGKVVVVNIWATWCAPCVVEMPTLATLQRKYEGTDLVVLPISVDREVDIPDARNFIDVHEPLPLYNDPKFAAPAAMKLKGLPSTVIYDREGREVARVPGEARWDSPEAYALIDQLLKE